MFQRVISQKGFWKSVIILGLIYMTVMFTIQWGVTGFSKSFFTLHSPLKILSVFLLGALFCGFSVTYAKFWAKLKQDDYKNK